MSNDAAPRKFTFDRPGSRMIAVTFALPQESADFLAELRFAGGSAGHISPGIIGNLEQAEVLLSHTGMGCERAGRSIAELLAFHRPEMLISAGFAGALDPKLSVGNLVLATNFSDLHLLARAKALDLGVAPVFGELVTADEVIETSDAKRALAQRSGALAVDMETAAIHDACEAAGVPMLSLRAISDTASDSLPAPLDVWFDVSRQKPRPFQLCAYLARHPGRIRRFVHFVQSVGDARRELTAALLKIVPRI